MPRVVEAVTKTLRLLVLVVGSGCAESAESGLHVEDVDATFGLARLASKGMETSSAPAAGATHSSTSSPIVATMSGLEAGAPASGTAPAPDAPPMVDAGPPPRPCRSLAKFTEKVTPILTERCTRCHDGTKSKATKTLDLTTARDTSAAAQQMACDQMLRGAPDSSEKSPIFAEVNPADASTVHDFKYPSAMAYMMYREAVLAWLTTETAN